VPCSCVDDNKLSGLMKGGKFVDQLSDLDCREGLSSMGPVFLVYI
jgi:hypothetical protein